MIGWGENGTAFGCDVTTSPNDEVHPKVVLVPDRVDPSGPFAWALFQGRWGQREIAMFNGPGGPNLGNKWNDPTTAFESWRTTVLSVPSSNAIGVNTTDLFCSLSERGSRAFVQFGAHPWAVEALVFAILGIVAFSVFRIWSFFMEALDVYGNELRTFLGIGAFAIPIGLLFNGFRVWASDVPPLEWMQRYFDGSDAGRLTATLFVAVFQQLAMLLLVAPAIIFAMKEVRSGSQPGGVEELRGRNSKPTEYFAFTGSFGAS